MNDVVVDSSVISKWVFPESDSPLADQVMTDVARRGGRPIVLDLARVEVTNAIWKRHYRGLNTIDEARQSLELLLGLPLVVHEANRLLRPALAHGESAVSLSGLRLSIPTESRGGPFDEPSTRR